MNFYTIVRPEHLNHYNYLFGGVLLRWVDEFAYRPQCASSPPPACTRATHEIEFTKSVKNGAMLRFQVEREKCGITSVSYRVVVYARDLQEHDEYHVFENVVTLVSLTKEGEKTPLPKNVKT